MEGKVLSAFAELCYIFKNSEIWLDKKALVACNNSLANANGYEYPMLLLYLPIAEMANYKERNFDRLKKEELSEFKELANAIWYAVDCRNDVRQSTSEMNIHIPANVKNILYSHFGISNDKPMNRNLLHCIAADIWKELGGSEEYGY